jgi:hypothetical protein
MVGRNLFLRRLPLLLAGALLACFGLAGAIAVAQPASAEALRAQFTALRAQDSGRLVDRPLYLRSADANGRMQGEVHALLDQPYDVLRRTLVRADAWCEILILHLNVKYCRATGAAPAELVAAMGRKTDQPLAEAFWLRASHRVAGDGDGYLQVSLQAPSGPMGMVDFQLALEAVPYTDRQSLLHLSYRYGYGTAARLAVQGYLGTLARDKVGFSVTGRDTDGRPVLVDGVRGMLERNTMRYYLAFEAYLGAAALPPAQRLDKSLRDWFDATERYARQLHEVEREPYLAMKAREAQRQASEPPPRSTP